MNDAAFNSQYRDPRWQRRSAEIKERADWKCEHCGADHKPLETHHNFYYPSREGVKLWDYADNELTCLCSECHKAVQWRLRIIRQKIGMLTVHELDKLMERFREIEDKKLKRLVLMRKAVCGDAMAKMQISLDVEAERWHNEGMDKVISGFNNMAKYLGHAPFTERDPWLEKGEALWE